MEESAVQILVFRLRPMVSPPIELWIQIGPWRRVVSNGKPDLWCEPGVIDHAAPIQAGLRNLRPAADENARIWNLVIHFRTSAEPAVRNGAT